MNVEKANKHYKKSFGIDLKSILDPEIWESLIDIVNLRNAIVHNNGKIDAVFKQTKTYERLKDRCSGNFINLKESDIKKYIDCLVDATVDVSNKYLIELYKRRNDRISNYYFSKNGRDAIQ